MLIEGADYFVRETDFPDGVGCHGMVLLNSDGTYSVYVDRNATDEQKMAALEHEVEHLTRDDLHGDKRVERIEGCLSDGMNGEEKRGYMESWIDWMEWCRREMVKKGIEPMRL